MTKQSRRKFTLNNQKTLAELSSQFEVSSVIISKWKFEFLENMSSVFEKDNTKKTRKTLMWKCSIPKSASLRSRMTF